MADERTKPIAAARGTRVETSGALTAAELRESSSTARAHAKAAAARCLELKLRFEASAAEQARWKESLTRVLPDLHDAVARYARCLRAEGAAPERMVILVKHALHEALPAVACGSSIILDLSVGCAIEAYYTTQATAELPGG